MRVEIVDDAKAVAAFYTPKAEIVTESGQALVGRDVIEQTLTDGFENDLKDSTLVVNVEKTRLIKPDVAIVDAEVQIKHGDADAFNLWAGQAHQLTEERPAGEIVSTMGADARDAVRAVSRTV